MKHQGVLIFLIIVLLYIVSCEKELLYSVRRWATGGDGAAKTEHFLNSREDPQRWDESTAGYDVGVDEMYKSYAEDLKANVDASIIDSHRDYIADTEFLATTGASHASARDDFNPPVQFHGLPRAALYSNPGAELTSRTSQSETAEDVELLRAHNGRGYVI